MNNRFRIEAISDQVLNKKFGDNHGTDCCI